MRVPRVLVGLIGTSVVAATALAGFTPSASAAPSIGSLAGAGERPGATRLSFTAGDSVQAQVDVGSGNLLVSVTGLTLPGVNSQVQLGAWYNSAASDKTPVGRLGKGWGLDYTPDVKLVTNADNSVTYTGPGGLTGAFDLASGSTTNYVAPAGFKVVLVKTSTGWTLTDNGTQEKLKFNTAGELASREDRNGNATTLAQSGTATYKNVGITTPAGGADARKAFVSTTAGSAGSTTIFQGASTALRQVKFDKTADTATQYTDARGRSTTFGYDTTGLLTSIAAPGNVTTQFAYDSSRRVTSITQVESSTGGPGNSVTRLAYPSSTQTLLAAPDTNQSQAITAVPRTTYTLNASQRVTKVVDAAGRERSRTFTANFDTAASTQGTGANASTTTNTYGANSGQSMTKTSSGEGSSQGFSYGNASGPAQYNPTGSSDDAGNASTYTYNGAGNQLTSSNANNAQAKVTYNADGTVATSTSPGNGTNSGSYSYTNKQVTGTSSPTGTTLGARAYTWDELGRLKTLTNGRGITTTNTYNENDQITSVAYSDGTSVTYGYDAAGRNNSRVDANGTTSYGYDQLGRLTSRGNTAGGGTITYTYDKASRLATATSDAGGTTTYEYDAAGEPTAISYPRPNTNPGWLRFTTDDQGRRTGSYLQAQTTALTNFAARNLTTYDKSGRVSRVTADTGPNSTDYTRIVDISYCYKSGTTPAGGCTATATNDRDKLQWKKDNVGGAATVYTYDTSGRLTKAAVTGGSSPNTYDYAYNANNNRLTADNQTLTFNPGNQITTTGYTYDAAGNATADPSVGATGITYTGADQLKSLTKGGVDYTYKHAGTDNTELLEQTIPDNYTYAYAYGRENEAGIPTVESLRRSRGGSTVTAAVTSDPITGQPLILRTHTGTQSLYVFDGTPGSPIALITSAAVQGFGYDYDPFGVPAVTQDSGGAGITENPYTFATGGVQDRTTGWVHYGARYYNPKTGTFTQQDTLDAPLDPLDGNRYAYAGNDPINLTDPTGDKIGCKIVANLAGAAGAAAAGGAGAYFGGPPGAAAGVYVGGAGTGGFVKGACNSKKRTVGGRLKDGLKSSADSLTDPFA